MLKIGLALLLLNGAYFAASQAGSFWYNGLGLACCGAFAYVVSQSGSDESSTE